MLKAISRQIEGGSTLFEALAKYPEIFSPIYVNMVRQVKPPECWWKHWTASSRSQTGN